MLVLTFFCMFQRTSFNVGVCRRILGILWEGFSKVEAGKGGEFTSVK